MMPAVRRIFSVKGQHSRAIAGVALILAGGAIATGSASTDWLDQALLNGMRWRLVGPYRGGRVTTVAGVPGQPLVYYQGTTGGGVWKTEDAGLSWEPMTDGFVKTGSVGAIAVAAS